MRERERKNREEKIERDRIYHGLPIRKEVFLSCKNMMVSARFVELKLHIVAKRLKFMTSIL